MRTQAAGRHRGQRLLATATLALAFVGAATGVEAWCWTQVACLVELRSPMRLGLADAAAATWRLLLHGGWRAVHEAFPTARERTRAPATFAYGVAAAAMGALVVALCLRGRARVRGWGAGSPLAKERGTPARLAVDRGWVTQRTWASARELRSLQVSGTHSGRPYLGYVGRGSGRMLAAEPEVQPLVVAPPRTGKTSGYVIPWLLEHDGPALVLSTKRDVYAATLARRSGMGRIWIYDPFAADSAGFTPLVPAATWTGAIRAGEALASAAHPDASGAANEFWDKEAASMLAPLLHAAALSRRGIADLVRWLDARDFGDAVDALARAGAGAAADQLEGVRRRDERNRETTVMSALNLLRAYRHPQVAAACDDDLTPARFLDGDANTIYVVAAGHDQEALRPVILALISAVYEAAIAKARVGGALQPRLYVLMDEAANIAPVRNLASWLSQCGDHGLVIATIWQSIAQIDQRYGRAARDAILAASTAQLFLPPLADPTTTGYLSAVLGEEPVTHAGASAPGRGSLSVAQQKAAPAPWLRQIGRGRAILIHRELPPAVLRAPGWWQQARFRSPSGGGHARS